jgi:hypothetical protein
MPSALVRTPSAAESSIGRNKQKNSSEETQTNLAEGTDIFLVMNTSRRIPYVVKIVVPSTASEKQIFLPIIISFEEVVITDTYHKFLGLTRTRDNMALS